MRLFKKIVSYLVILIILIQFTNIISWAEIPKPFRVTIEEQKKVINKDSVMLEWDTVDGADEYHVNYHDKDGLESVARSVYSEQNNILADNLQPGVIYDFSLQAYNDNNIELIGANEDYKLQVITGIKNFRAYRLDEEIQENQTVIGTKPGLKIKWDKPFVRSGENYTTIEDEKIDYEINVRKSKYSIQDSVERFKVIFEAGEYHLYRWNGNQFQQVTNETDYNFQTDDGISFDWTKEADEADENFNKESALLPGTLYYMEIYPIFKSGSEFEDVNYVKTDLDSAFTSTYLKVELTRNNNNVLFTGYRVLNEGTFAVLPNFLYEFWVGPDASSLTKQYYEYEQDAGEYAEEYLEAFITNAAAFENYYKLTAKANELLNGKPIELSSQIINVNLSEADNTITSVPENLEVVKTEISEDGESKITVRWDRPSEYNQMLDSGDYNYHMFLNTAPTDMIDEDGNYVTQELENDDGDEVNYDIKFREAFNVKIQAYDENLPLRERLKIIDENDVAENELDTGKDRIELTFKNTGLFAESEDNYPSKLIPNKVYYLKMYLSKDNEAITHFTVPVAFVTPKLIKEVPFLPDNIEVAEVTNNEIEINWDTLELNDENFFPVDDDPNIDYEISLSQSMERDESTGQFTDPIYTVTSDQVGQEELEIIEFLKDPLEGQYYGAKIKGTDLNNSQERLKENTTYYMIIRTKLSLNNDDYQPKYSIYSNLLPATTLKENIEEPSEDEKYPTAPVDFSIATDSEGTELIGSVGVTLTWDKNKIFDDVKYKIIRTLRPVSELNDWDSNIENIPDDFEPYEITNEDITDSYREETGDYMLSLEDLYPNSLYFFNIQAYRSVVTQEGEIILGSEWITLPVTTTLINTPTNLKIVNVENGDKDYSYFDKYHNLKISWDAIQLKDHEDSILEKRFDIAIKKSSESEYTILSSEDENRIIRFRNEKTPELQKTTKEHYSAIITELEANTKYDIKVRVIDPYEYPASQYTLKVTGRTAFSKEEYDDNYRNQYKNSIFNEKIQKYKESWYWVYSNEISSKDIEYKVKIKGDKFIYNTDENGNVVIDFSLMLNNELNKESVLEAYIPLNVIDYIINNNKNIEIKTSYGSILLYNKCFNKTKNDALKEMLEKREDKAKVKDVYVKTTLEDLGDTNTYKRKSNQILLSNIISIESIAEAVDMTDEIFEEKIDDMLFGDDGTGEEEGLIYKKRDELEQVSDNFEEMEEEINEIVEEIDREIAEYIEDIITSSSFVEYSEDMDTLPYNMLLSLNYNNKNNDGTIGVYYIEDRDDTWKILPGNLNDFYNLATVNTNKFHEYKFGVIKQEKKIFDISDNDYKDDIQYLENEYSISDIFSKSGYIYPEKNITIKESILVFDKIADSYNGRYRDNSIENIILRHKLEGFEKLNLSREITKENATYISIRLYEVLVGIDIEKISTNKVIYINDDRNISIDKLKYVLLAIDLGVADKDGGFFKPDDYITRGNYLSMIKRVLDLHN